MPSSVKPSETLTTADNADVIDQAVDVIDQALGTIQARGLVSADEVADLLLDVRTLLTAPGEDAAVN